MTTFVPPYTVTVTDTTGGLAQCSYVDGNDQPLPAEALLTTSTPANQSGSLLINFTETVVDGLNLRLVGAAVKTVGNDPTMNAHNYLQAERTEGSEGDWLDGVLVPWAPNQFTTRGLVLLFAQVTNSGDMVNFFPSADPQTKNNEDLGD